jgi:pSer/pThr/pTyr-binding forkhead associated (FHA) protein
MEGYIEVKINVFEHTGQRARIKKSLSVRGLIEEILKEFDDIGAETPEKYILQLKGLDKPLHLNQTIAQLDIQPQDELSLGYLHQTIRKMLDPKDHAILRMESTNLAFDIQWIPALIGRPSTDVNHNILLAANMQLLAMGLTISRRHAQIIFNKGRYFIEPLADNNPVFLNGKELPTRQAIEIHFGDRIGFGQQKITCVFEKKVKLPEKADEQSTDRQAYQPTPPPVVEPETPPAPEAAVPTSMLEHQTQTVEPKMQPSYLVVEKSINPASIGQTVAIATYPFLLGRSIALLAVESGVSRQHGEINFDEDRHAYFFKDLRSTNGSTLNGQAVPPDTSMELRKGDRLGLGHSVVLRFEV